jgi:hypothetical protein
MARVAHCIVAAAVALAGCSRVEEPPGQRRLAAASSSAVPAPPPLPRATRLLSAPGSPYNAVLFADAEAIELLTGTTAYRLVPGEPPGQRPLDLGFAATVGGQGYLYWSKGALWSAKRGGSGAPARLGPLAEQPQRIVASRSGTELAWLERSATGRYAIAKLASRRTQPLYRSLGSIDTLTLLGDAVFFVERPSSGGWRVGRVALAGGLPSFSAEKPGRWPAMLDGGEELVFYDGNRREVVALSLDLQRERTLVKDFICSPLAVAAARVYCANVDGVFELRSQGEPRRLVDEPGQVVTALAATSSRLAFVSDVGNRGQDQLALSVVALDAER